MNKVIRIGLDTSKNVFQLHGVDEGEQPVLRKKLSRRQLLAFLEKQPSLRVGLEACGASHHWAREIAALGHEAMLLPPQYVKAYVKRGKSDAADAEAICEAMSRPAMRFVAIKTPNEQAIDRDAGARLRAGRCGDHHPRPQAQRGASQQRGEPAAGRDAGRRPRQRRDERTVSVSSPVQAMNGCDPFSSWGPPPLSHIASDQAGKTGRGSMI